MSESVLYNGIATTIIGMVVVYIGLILLIAIISLMRFISGENSASGGKTDSKNKPAASAAPPSPPAPSAADNTPLVLAITAAIYAVMAQEGVTAQSGFVVRRIRRY